MPNVINPQKGIDQMNNNSIKNIVLFIVTIFQQATPCNKCNCFLANILAFILSFISFDLFLLCFKGIVEGHCPSLMTRGDNVIHKHFTEMRRMARDETPFLLAMPPRPTTLFW
jgi:hypothetical protein